MVLEQKINLSKEVIYAVGFLHDIGRCLEYKDGVKHIKLHRLSIDILKECDFNKEE